MEVTDIGERDTATNSASGNGPGHRPTRGLIQDIVGNIQEIIRSEVRLAKTEVVEEVAKAGKAGGLIAGAGILALFGFGLVLVTCVAALALIMPVWLAALIMGVAVFVVAGTCYMMGRQRMRNVHPVPERTVQTLKDDVAWLKAQTR